MNKLWERMNCQKEVDFKQMNTFVMSYGTFVWFKYDALSPLFDLNLTEEDVPSEPLPQNSILHAIERLLVYIAWDKPVSYTHLQTDLNLVLGVDFNRQVASETALYWKKEKNSLSALINQVDSQNDFSDWGLVAKQNMKDNYTWEKIVGEYEELFLS